MAVKTVKSDDINHVQMMLAGPPLASCGVESTVGKELFIDGTELPRGSSNLASRSNLSGSRHSTECRSRWQGCAARTAALGGTGSALASEGLLGPGHIVHLHFGGGLPSGLSTARGGLLSSWQDRALLAQVQHFSIPLLGFKDMHLLCKAFRGLNIRSRQRRL